MGFVAPEKLEALNDAGLTRAIGVLFSAVAQGGGAQVSTYKRSVPSLRVTHTYSLTNFIVDFVASSRVLERSWASASRMKS